MKYIYKLCVTPVSRFSTKMPRLLTLLCGCIIGKLLLVIYGWGLQIFVSSDCRHYETII